MDLPVDYTKIDWRQRRLVREEYIRSQKGLCVFCSEPLTGSPGKEIRLKSVNWDLFPTNFRKYPIHLDRDHDTGMTRGAVHMLCNAVMWCHYGQ